MQIILPHEIVFSTKNKISVSDVANSLLANEQIVLSLGRILEACVDGLTVEKIDVKFVSATINSPLKEALAAGILFTFQDDLKSQVPKMIDYLTGTHIDGKYDTLVTVLFLIVTIYGVERAWELFKKPKKGDDISPVPQPIINNYGTLIQAGSAILEIPPARLTRAVQQSFPPKQARMIARNALAFIQPAKRERGATITGAGFSIDSATIESSPSALDIAISANDETEVTSPYEKIEVVIHANDVDHNSSGWAGHIPGIWEKRLKMKLSPGIFPSNLFGKEKIIADIVLVSKLNEDGNYIPSLFHVINVYS